MSRPGEYYERGPSPWVPATILGVILLIATTPYRMAPDPSIAYQPTRMPTGFPPALIWIPLAVFVMNQFFGGSYRPYRNDRFGRPGVGAVAYGGGLAGGYGGGLAGGYGDGMYPGGPYDNYHYRYNGPRYDKGLISSFVDYGGHWLLIMLGIWLFSLVGAGSAPAATAAIPPSRLRFPWSLFAPQAPQIVMPLM